MIDQTEKPCINFYKFACGKFIKEAVIPKDKKEMGPRFDAEDTLHKRLKMLFADKSEADEPDVFSSLRKMYSSCMDYDLIEKVGQEKLLEKIKDLGGWSVLKGKELAMDNFVWQKLIEKAKRMGFIVKQVLDISIKTSPNNTTKEIIAIDQPEFGLAREYLIKGVNNKNVKAYYKYMVDTAVYLGANEKIAKHKLEEVLKFEIKLAEMSVSLEETRNKTALNNQMTIKELSKMYLNYDWLDHINNIIDSKMTDNEIVNLVVPKYFTALGTYIPTVDVQVIANYMIWRYVNFMMPYTNNKGLQIKQAFNKVMYGYETDIPSWKRCVGHLGSLGHAVGSLYARKYFPPHKKYAVVKIAKNIKNEFKLMLPEVKWLDKKGKEQAKLKIDQMRSFIGYDEEILNNDLLNEFYKGLELNSKHVIENQLSLNKFLTRYKLTEFRRPKDKHSWKTDKHGDIAVFESHYFDMENSIYFPAGYLDGVVFQDDRPIYMNYGATGIMIGHAMTHGFDDIGSQMDSEGNLVNQLSEETKEMLDKKYQCIIDQYNNLTVDVNGEILNINGYISQGQNFADNLGIKLAIRAYNRMIAENREEPRLPGLPYTPRQLFWLSAAMSYCIAKNPETWTDTVIRGEHAPDMFRVNVPFKNREEFSRDWNCPTGTKMNPIKKCKI